MKPKWIPKPRKSVKTLHLIKCLEEAPKLTKKPPKMEPKWSQNAPQSDLKSIKFQAHAPKRAQSSKKLAKWFPKAPQMELTWSQNVSQSSQKVTRGGQER